jgi:hypothetical protein
MIQTTHTREADMDTRTGPERMTEYQRKELFHKWAVTAAAAFAAWYAYDQFQSTHQLNQQQAELTQAHVKGLREKLDAEREAERHLREKEAAEREKDYRLRFYERRLAVYDEACEVTARIATHRTVEEAGVDIRRFEQLVLGKLTAAADQEVMDAVWSFNDALRDLGPGRRHRVPTDPQGYSFRVATACEESMSAAFPTVPFAKTVSAQQLKGVGSLPPPSNPAP